ncbi:MAG TPA: undecaprenyl-diphosphate phosphatase, partial [Fimbriimonas sp.]
MDLIQAVVFGVIQGLTEWLPISSTAHLRFIPALLGWRDPGAAFTATIQLGTILAVVIFFWRDLSQAVAAWARSITDRRARESREAKIGWGAFWGTLPIIAVGLLLRDHIESTFRSLYVVAGALILF